jgi:hypothetical protein
MATDMYFDAIFTLTLQFNFLKINFNINISSKSRQQYRALLEKLTSAQLVTKVHYCLHKRPLPDLHIYFIIFILFVSHEKIYNVMELTSISVVTVIIFTCQQANVSNTLLSGKG